MIEMGWKVQDVITGFTGIVTGLCDYITGCNQALVTPGPNEEGQSKNIDAKWIDTPRLKRIGDSVLTLDPHNTPGPDLQPPVR